MRTLLIVDDQAEFRTLARSLLEADGFVVIGDAADGASAVAAAAALRPEVVLLDVQLPDVDGFAVADRLALGDGGVPAIVLTSSRPASAYRRRLRASPAVGFLPKSELSGAALSALLPA